MPRVIMKTKNRAGRDRVCGHCGNPIHPGHKYRSWSFRYGGTHFRCMEAACAPRRSDLTQSLMGEVYLAIESAEDQLADLGSVEEIKGLIEEVAGTVEEVKSQYEEAAEPFGGQGENQERADELDGWHGELEGFYPDEPEEFDEDENAEEAQARSDAEDISYSAAMDLLRAEHAEAVAEAVEGVRNEAQELLNGCPL